MASAEVLNDGDIGTYVDSGEGVFWGRRGAGAVLLAKDTGRLLVLRRSANVEEPGTWGTAGGAIDSREDPEKAARREIREELGYEGGIKLYPAYVFQRGTFRYYNFIGVVPEEFKPKLNWENDRYRWVAPNKLPKPIHFGLEALMRESGGLIKSLIDTRASIHMGEHGSARPDIEKNRRRTSRRAVRVLSRRRSKTSRRRR